MHPYTATTSETLPVMQLNKLTLTALETPAIWQTVLLKINDTELTVGSTLALDSKRVFPISGTALVRISQMNIKIAQRSNGTLPRVT